MNTNGFTNSTNYLSTDYTDFHRGIRKCTQMVSQIGTNDGTRMKRKTSLINTEYLCLFVFYS